MSRFAYNFDINKRKLTKLQIVIDVDWN